MFSKIFFRLKEILDSVNEVRNLLLQQQAPTQNDEWFDTAGLMAKLNISSRTIYRLRKSGAVSSKQLSGKWYYKIPEFPIQSSKTK